MRIMLAVAVFIGETVVLRSVPQLSLPIILSLLVPMLSEMGSFALNDYLDIETDRLNKKMRPLVKGTISPGFALWFSVISLALSLVLAYFINTDAFFIALVFDALAIAYDWKLKDLPMLGNIYIGLSMAIPFIFGDFVVSDKSRHDRGRPRPPRIRGGTRSGDREIRAGRGRRHESAAARRPCR